MGTVCPSIQTTTLILNPKNTMKMTKILLMAVTLGLTLGANTALAKKGGDKPSKKSDTSISKPSKPKPKPKPAKPAKPAKKSIASISKPSVRSTGGGGGGGGGGGTHGVPDGGATIVLAGLGLGALAMAKRMAKK